MSIDLVATKARLLATGRTIAGWSRVHGLNAETVKMFLRGRFVSNNPKQGVYGSIVSALRKDKFLVMIQEEKKAA